MSPVPSDLPPGVSGTEPQITGDWPTVHIPATEVHSDAQGHEPACDLELAGAVLGGPDEVSCAACLSDFGWIIPGIVSEDFGDFQEQLGYYLADVPDATPAQIREAVQEFLDRDPREA